VNNNHNQNKQNSSQISTQKHRIAPNKVKVFDVVEMQTRKNNASSKSNVHQNMGRYLSYLGNTNGELDLLPVTNTVINELLRLVQSFPNFKSVIEFYVKQIALQRLNPHAAIASEPVLIIGGAGIGKTAFTLALARVLKIPCEIIALSTATAGFIIAGSTPAWAEGKPGKIVEKIARSQVANPLIMLDELDKVGGDKRYSPIGALYQLLEQETAKIFMDEGLEIPSDCSHVLWIATANDETLIPEPILSRFNVFHVRSPSAKEMKNVVNSIYSSVIRNNQWGHYFDNEISGCAIDDIIDSRLAPRKIQQAIKDACAGIALEYYFKKIKKKPSKGQFKVMSEHINIELKPSKPSMGFYAH